MQKVFSKFSSLLSTGITNSGYSLLGQFSVKTVYNPVYQIMTRLSFSLAVSLFGYYTLQQTLCNKNEVKPNKPSELYSWGAGQYGQLGIGSDLNKAVPQRVEELDNANIISVAARSDISAAISESGKVYTWGRAKVLEGGILGHENITTANVLSPTQIESLSDKHFSQISAGTYHMAGITKDGHLYTWGNNEHGRLGHDPEPIQESSKKVMNTKSVLITGATPPKRVLGDLKDKVCIQVSCGAYHTICLTSDGTAYIWGSYKKGVLGDESNEDVKVPKKMEFFSNKKIVKVCAGPDFNYALTSDGKIYSWGNNDYGQLGNPSKSSMDAPHEISGLGEAKIIDIAAGETFGAALSENGKLFTWGYGNEGQLGHGNKNDLKSPKHLEFSKKVVSVSCGNGHTGYITNDGELYMFGRGREGQLGRADTIESTVTYRVSPQKVETFKNNRVVGLACGGYHTLALVQ